MATGNQPASLQSAQYRWLRGGGRTQFASPSSIDAVVVSAERVSTQPVRRRLSKYQKTSKQPMRRRPRRRLSKQPMRLSKISPPLPPSFHQPREADNAKDLHKVPRGVLTDNPSRCPAGCIRYRHVNTV